MCCQQISALDVTGRHLGKAELHSVDKGHGGAGIRGSVECEGEREV